MVMIKTYYNTGKNNPNYGKGVWWQRKGLPHPRLGMKNSEETRTKISEALKGKATWNKGLYKENNPQWKGSRAWYHLEARKVWEEYWKEPVPHNYMIHHIDENYKNNDISNLVAMGRGKHSWLHRRKNQEKLQ